MLNKTFLSYLKFSCFRLECHMMASFRVLTASFTVMEDGASMTLTPPLLVFTVRAVTRFPTLDWSHLE